MTHVAIDPQENDGAGALQSSWKLVRQSGGMGGAGRRPIRRSWGRNGGNNSRVSVRAATVHMRNVWFFGDRFLPMLSVVTMYRRWAQSVWFCQILHTDQTSSIAKDFDRSNGRNSLHPPSEDVRSHYTGERYIGAFS